MRRKILPNWLFSSSKTPPSLAKLKNVGRASYKKSDKNAAAFWVYGGRGGDCRRSWWKLHQGGILWLWGFSEVGGAQNDRFMHETTTLKIFSHIFSLFTFCSTAITELQVWFWPKLRILGFYDNFVWPFVRAQMACCNTRAVMAVWQSC